MGKKARFVAQPWVLADGAGRNGTLRLLCIQRTTSLKRAENSLMLNKKEVSDASHDAFSDLEAYLYVPDSLSHFGSGLHEYSGRGSSFRLRMPL